jgi:Caspase domain
MSFESDSDTDSATDSETDTVIDSDTDFDPDSISTTESESGRRFAILIGNNDYHHEVPLNSCCKDAKDMANILKCFGKYISL